MVLTYIKKSMKWFREQLHEAARLKKSTHEIALGMCIGTFIGFLPLFGFQVLLGILVIFLFDINKIATFLGIFVTNPITSPPIFAFNYYLGRIILGMGPLGESESLFAFETLWLNFKPLLVGSLIMGVIACIVAYFVTFYVVKHIRKMQLKERVKEQMKKELKRLKKLQKLEQLQKLKKLKLKKLKFK